MEKEHSYVAYLYNTYKGRIPIGVGYDQELSEIFPFVFEDTKGICIGIAAVAVIDREDLEVVHIYHLSALKQQLGNGTKILQELCRQADKFNVVLSLSPIFISMGEELRMSDDELRRWYCRFGFTGEPSLTRAPDNSCR